MFDWGRYIGLPFGDGPGQVTCWGLVRRVYADVLCVDLPAYGEISSRDLMRVARAMSAGAADDGWHVPAVPQAADVVLMRGPSGGPVVHVGVLTDPAHVLHVEEATDSVRVPVTHYSVAGRIAGYRRLRT